ncbi:hypothetical protein GPECTOR_30g275 [Gonium pectorale]|uniref:GCF C-terminal domain-containing protein n=1 Tax=Gonium pectorale TaxID=33097 RepID=A0A150GEB4_GONPE|nr:hypothetical protein GPECTOR_30g275 [Gonium pectorale]|eukprot:KXZ48179.1 hypothetical protein GPECTOR_30g275 [Gonium pectorale]
MAFKQRKFRSKASAEEQDDGEDGPPPIRPPQHQPKKDTAVAKPKPGPSTAALGSTAGDSRKDSKGSKLNLLSFEEDGDDPGFVPKKDSKKEKQRSKLARAPPIPDLPTEAVPQTLRSSAGEYTAERMKELQRNAISFSAVRLTGGADGGGGAAAGGGGGGGGGTEPLIKLSGSFKPAGGTGGQPKDDRFSFPGSSIALVKPEVKPEEAMPLPPPPRPGGAAPAAGGAAAGAAPDGEDDDDDLGIPDEQTILAAKAKRERLRQAHFAPDYVPLSGLGVGLGRLRAGGGAGGGLAAAARGGSAGPGGAASGTEGGAGSGSDSEAEAEDMMRMKFSGKEAGGGRAARKDASQYAPAAGGDDDEEAFAEEQLRKAMRLQQVGGAGTAPVSAATAGSGAAAGAGGMRAGPGPGSAAAAAMAAGASAAFAGGGMGMAAGGSRLAALTAAGDSVVASLVEGLSRLQASHKQVQQSARRAGEGLTAALARVEGFESELRVAGDKYLYMQQLKAYVADLCECLQVKSAIVEELEDTRLELMEDRAQAARTAATNTDRDLMTPAEAAVAAAMAALSRGAGAAAAGAAAAAAAAEAEDRLLDEEGPEELDEFGRNVNLQRRRELEERATARKRLLAAEGERLASALGGAAVEPLTEGPQEDEATSSRYAQRFREIVEAGSTAFADADEEYASIAAVKRRLEEWKARFPKDYTSAYMHLSTPALFAPYVRLELLRWDPLYGGGEGTAGVGSAVVPYKGFDSHDWYGELFEYGMGSAAGGGPAPEDDPDADLVPQLVRKLVLPLALHWIERCWDVLNVSHTRCVAALASELLVYVPAEEERMVELLAVLRGSLEAAAEAVSLPPWPPAVLACCPLASRVLFRRFRAALRLLHGVSAFEGLLARGLLTALALGRVVGGQLMPYLRAAAAGGEQLAFAVGAAEAVAGALHEEWFRSGPPGEAGPLLEHVATLGRALEQQLAGGGGGGAAALAGRLARVMGRLGDGARGARLAAAFGVRL